MALEDGYRQNILSDLDPHNRAMSLPIQEVVRKLVDLLGATTVAVIGGVQETRAVHQWTTDREPQRPHVLRFALQVALMISTVTNRDVARAWFHGANPYIGDEVPMLLLRDRPLEVTQASLLAAARSFAGRDASPSQEISRP